MERGIIAQISGPVVDVEIVQGELPRLREMLTVEKNGDRKSTRLNSSHWS